MGNYALRLLDHGISEARYREMQYFCYQYREKKQRLAALLHASPEERVGRSEGHAGDPVASLVAKRERLLRDCEMIEQTALEAAGGSDERVLYQHLLRQVTMPPGIRPAVHTVPCSRRTFYNMRSRFFILLDKKRTHGQYF